MPETDAPPSLLDQIVAQRAAVVDAQNEAETRIATETRRLAELLAETRTNSDVSLAAAARAMGVTKGYAHQLVTRLDEGRL